MAYKQPITAYFIFLMVLIWYKSLLGLSYFGRGPYIETSSPHSFVRLRGPVEKRNKYLQESHNLLLN